LSHSDHASTKIDGRQDGRRHRSFAPSAPHDLRRSFCSLAGRRGIDPIIAANITGHSLATWQSSYARDFGKQHRDEARQTLLAAGFGTVR
jgi:hypothetical protein